MGGDTASRGSETLPAGDDVEKAPVKEKIDEAKQSNGDQSLFSDGQPQLSQTKIYIITCALCLNVLLSAMDQSIIATALPVIASEFDSAAAYTWVGSSYLLASAATGPSWGKTSDIFGRKPMLFAANILFLVGSLMCGVAKDIGTLIAGRAVAGAGGGGISLLPLICISDIVPIRKRSLYVGAISMVWAFATSVGPVLGGLFTTGSTWRWCFYINLPIGGCALLALYFFLHIHTPKISLLKGLRRIDWSGTILVVSGTVLFLFGLEIGGVVSPWSSPEVICFLVFGVFLWALFLVNERYIPKRPIMPLQLFKNRSNLATLLICLLHGLMYISGPYYFPLYFQAVLGATPILSGVYLLPYNAAFNLGTLSTSWLINKFGRYLVLITIGMTVSTLGYGLVINLPQQAGWAKIFVYTTVAGLGIGPNFQAPLTAMQSEVSKENMAVGISSFIFTRTTAAAASIVIGGTIFRNAMQEQLPRLEAALGNQLAETLSGRMAEANVGLINTLPLEQQEIVRDAFLSSLSKIWYFYTAAAGLGIIVSFFIRESVPIFMLFLSSLGKNNGNPNIDRIKEIIV